MELEPDSSSSSEESQDVESEQSSSSDVEATMEDAIRDVLQNPEGETPEGDEDDDYDEDEPLAAEAAPSAEEVVGDPQNTDQPAEVFHVCNVSQLGLDFTLYRNKQIVIMPMPVWIRTLPENLQVFLIRPIISI